MEAAGEAPALPAAAAVKLRRDYAYVVSSAPSPRLSASQLETLGELGEERTAEVGDVLYRIGDQRYPFIAIVEGEVAIVDEAGNELTSHGASGFLGELNLLSGQTVFVNAVVTQPLRYIEVDRDALRPLLFEDGPLSDLLLSTFIARRELLQGVRGLGMEVVGPRSSEATMRMLEFARSSRLPFTWRDPSGRTTGPPPSWSPDSMPRACHWCDCREARSWKHRRPARSRARSESAASSSRGRRSTWWSWARGPAGLGAAVYGASEGLDTLVIDSTALGGQAGSSRRIENYLGFPAGISGSELTSRAVTQARKFDARLATPFRALSLEPGTGRHTLVSRRVTRSPPGRSCSRPARSTGGFRLRDSPTTRA